MPLRSSLRAPLTHRFQDALLLVAARSTPPVQTVWDRLPNYDEESVPLFTARTAPLFAAVKQSSLTRSLAYHSTLAGVAPPAIAVADIAVEAATREAFISFWQALGSGLPFDEAAARGRLRIESIVSDHAQATARATGKTFVERAPVRTHGWERIANIGACVWCSDAALGHYRSADTADFGHTKCRCTPAPLYE